MIRLRAATLALTLTAGTVLAGQVTTVHYQEREPASSESKTGTMRFRDNLMRMEIQQDGDEGPNLIIFRGDKNLLWVVDEQDKSYFQMDRATVERMSNQISGALKQYEAQLAQLPPEQRAQLEKMLKGRLPQPAPKEKVEIRKTGDTATLEGYPCLRYDIYRGDTKDSEIWATDLGNVQGAHNFSALLRSIGEFWEPIMNSFPGGRNPGELDFAALGGLQGFPIVVKNYDAAGRVTNEVHMTSISVQEMPDTIFEVDPSYKLRDPFKGRE